MNRSDSKAETTEHRPARAKVRVERVDELGKNRIMLQSTNSMNVSVTAAAEE